MNKITLSTMVLTTRILHPSKTKKMPFQQKVGRAFSLLSKYPLLNRLSLKGTAFVSLKFIRSFYYAIGFSCGSPNRSVSVL